MRSAPSSKLPGEAFPRKPEAVCYRVERDPQLGDDLGRSVAKHGQCDDIAHPARELPQMHSAFRVWMWWDEAEAGTVKASSSLLLPPHVRGIQRVEHLQRADRLVEALPIARLRWRFRVARTLRSSTVRHCALGFHGRTPGSPSRRLLASAM